MKIAIWGSYKGAEGNIGDEAILSGVLSALRTAQQPAQVSVFSINPKGVTELHHVDAVRPLPYGLRSCLASMRSGNFRDTLRVIQRCDILIIGGGQVLVEPISSGIPWTLGCFVLASVARIYRKKIMLYGVGIGQLKNPLGRVLVRKIVESCKAVTVRDQASATRLKEIGILGTLIKVTADPVFCLRPSSNLETDAKADDQIRVGLSLREWWHRPDMWPNLTMSERIRKQKEFLDHIEEVCLFLHDQIGASYVGLPFYGPQDLPVLKEMKFRLGNKLQVIEDKLAPIDVLNRVGETQALIGMRLHSLIFAAINLKPMIALSYQEKTTAFMDEIGLPQLCHDVDNHDIESLKRKISYMWDCRASITQALGERIAILRAKERENLNTFLSLI